MTWFHVDTSVFPSASFLFSLFWPCPRGVILSRGPEIVLKSARGGVCRWGGATGGGLWRDGQSAPLGVAPSSLRGFMCFFPGVSTTLSPRLVLTSLVFPVPPPSSSGPEGEPLPRRRGRHCCGCLGPCGVWTLWDAQGVTVLGSPVWAAEPTGPSPRPPWPPCPGPVPATYGLRLGCKSKLGPCASS